MNNLINKIHNIDNREILKQIPDKSIQVFLEDMPYGITACKWDTMPDLQEYWDLRLSKIKDNGCFVLFGSEPFSSYLRMSNIKMYKYDWIWRKNKKTGIMNCKFRPLKTIENIIVFSKGRAAFNQFKNNSMIYNPQNIKEINQKKNGKIKPTALNNIRSINKEYICKYKNYPIDLLQFSNDIGIHPTQKPVALFEYLIKTYSNENDLIFDGFSGSGTTAIACYNLNRNFICCELEKEYYDKSIERLKEVKNNLFDNYI